MPPYKTEAVNLKRASFGEADKLLTLYSKNYGKIKAVAKGACKSSSKFGGRLEIFGYNDYLLARGRGLYIISQCETKETFQYLREEATLLKTGAYLVKLVDALTEIGHPNLALFNLLLDSLYLLKDHDPELVKKSFEVRLIEVEGLSPTLDRCVKCSKKLPEKARRVRFSISLGGIICSQCLRADYHAREISGATLQAISALKTGEFNFKFEPAILGQINQLLPLYLGEHLGRDIFRLAGDQNDTP